MPPPTLANALASAAATLALHPSARLDAELLLARALGQPRSYLFAWPERTLTEAQAQQFAALAARRAAGEPMAHILGQREFWSLDLEVTPDTLIPRPETELLVERALSRIPTDAQWDVADLGTGTGAIALAVASERPSCRIVACDESAAALAVAEHNARGLALRNLSFHHGSWYTPFARESFDIILSNPPYIRAGDPHLGVGDVRFEPQSALVAGADGLDDLRSIIADAPDHLRPGGYLLVEHGFDQGAAVAELFTGAGFDAVTTTCDLSGQPRVTEGRWIKKRLPP
ncbi:MAG: peptide chain release factor N(5)-glutamine methyltransferase [Thiohalobacteraceae bacterium]